jgi:hypothetical protein
MLRSLWFTCIKSFLDLLEDMGAICRQANHVYALSCVLKMFKKSEKPTTCGMWSVIHFLNARNMKPANIHRQLCEVYGEHATSDSMVRRWVRHFNEGRENVHDDLRSSRPSVVNEDLIHAVEERFKRTEDLPFCHFACIFHKFHSHFFTKLCLIKFVF